MDAQGLGAPSDSLSPPISVKDLKQVAELLSIVAERGAFGIAEFEDVGALYRRINEFIAAAAGA